MKAEIQNGRLYVVPEDCTDEYALRKWCDDNVSNWRLMSHTGQTKLLTTENIFIVTTERKD